MTTVYQIYKQKILLTRSGAPWDRSRIAREIRKMNPSLAKTPYGLSYDITDDILARLLATCNYAKKHMGRRPRK